MKTSFDQTTEKHDAPSLPENQGRRHFHVMVKPGSSTCKLDRDYYFYFTNPFNLETHVTHG